MDSYSKEFYKFGECFENRKLFDGTMYIPLGRNNLKVELLQKNPSDSYRNTVKMTVIGKNQGEIDNCQFTFLSVWGEQEFDDYREGKTYHQYLNNYSGNTFWNVSPPTEEQIAMIDGKIQEYAEMYMDQEQSLSMEQFM